MVADCKLPRAQLKTGAQANQVASHEPQLKDSSSSSALPTPTPHSHPHGKPRAEPSFEEFLAHPEPQGEPYMPSLRPYTIQCYFNRDEGYYQSCQKLASAITIQPPDNLKGTFSLDQIAKLLAFSNKPPTSQFQIGHLSKDRFLVLPPPGTIREEMVAAIPKRVWEEGFTLQPYSPLLDAKISIPFFKIWVDIQGVPLELYTEAHMARVVSSFGTYLGSMEPRIIGDCQTWSVFISSDDLTLVPHCIEIRIGGLVYNAQVRTRKWSKGQVFPRSDLPPAPTPFHPPTSTPPPPPVTAQKDITPNPIWFEGDDVVPMSLTALREIFRHIPPEELPSDLAACLEGDPLAIAANRAAGKR